MRSEKVRHVVTTGALVVFLCGIAGGFVLGAVVPANLPGMKRAVLPYSLSSIVPSDGRNMFASIGESPAPAQPDPAGSRESASGPTEGGYDPAAHLGELPMDSKESYVAYMLAHTKEKREFLEQRWEVSRRTIETGELQGEAIPAFLKTPRELFVREKNLSRAYDDTWLPIGYGATITDPDVVSMMTTTLALKPGLKVLEIGTGSGYQSAMLSFITKQVYSIEIIEPLYEETDRLYTGLATDYPSFANIRRKLGDGFYGWEKYAPFDRIIVTCAIDHVPPPLIKQLIPGGIMVVPLGPPGRQYIMEVKKVVNADGTVDLVRRDVYNGLSVKFIPFRNDEGQSYSGG